MFNTSIIFPNSECKRCSEAQKKLGKLLIVVWFTLSIIAPCWLDFLSKLIKNVVRDNKTNEQKNHRRLAQAGEQYLICLAVVDLTLLLLLNWTVCDNCEHWLSFFPALFAALVCSLYLVAEGWLSYNSYSMLSLKNTI